MTLFPLQIMNTALPAYQGRMQGLAGAMQMGLMAVSPTIGGAIWNATIGKPWPISPHVVYGKTTPRQPSAARNVASWQDGEMEPWSHVPADAVSYGQAA